MVKLKDFSDKHLQIIIEKIISEDISKEWLRDFLLRKKLKVGHHSRDLSLSEFFDVYIWDNLTEEQQKKIIESLNLIIEEDLFLGKQPGMNYWSHLLDFAILHEKKSPGKINVRPFIIWKKNGYPNLRNHLETAYLTKPRPERINELTNELNTKIENAFMK